MRKRVLRANLWVGIAGLAGSSALLAIGVPFVQTWYYSLAWWFFILAMDGWNFRRTGASPLAASGRDFAAAAFLSVPVWLLFEFANLRLKNWSYHGLPLSVVERWAGYFVAFASVVPALSELGHFFERVFEGKPVARLRVRLGCGARIAGPIAGAFSIVLALVWPRLFFPLVWVGIIFLLDPLNVRLGTPSFARDLEEGRGARLWGWMAAGLAAGILWEFWNWWAGAHWQYHIPYLNFGRIFQMPIFGYGGFIPFALEVFALRSFLFALRRRIGRRRAMIALAVLALLAFDLIGFALIDRFSVLR
jgi:hypothetical protein